MRSAAHEVAKTAVVVYGAMALIGGAIGWCIGEILARHDPRRRYG